MAQPLILASTSKSRRKLLEQTGVTFTVEVSDFEEDMSLALPPVELVQQFSQGKARAVAQKHDKGIVIGADTVVVLDGQALGKPKDISEAKLSLQKINGKTHIVLTGLTVINVESGEEITKTIETKVLVKQMTSTEIETYLASGEPTAGHAGGYATEERGAAIVRSVEGEATNVSGLPLCTLNEILQKYDVSLLA